MIRKYVTHREATILITAFAICLSMPHGGAGVLKAQAPEQKASLKLRSEPSGFSGTYQPGDRDLFPEAESYSVEARYPSKDFSLSQIRKRDGRTLAECIRDQHIVEVALGNIKVAFDITDKKIVNVESKRELNTSESEEAGKVLQKFRRSKEAAQIRAILVDLIRQRTQTEQPHLLGFAVLAMVVGEESGSPGTAKLDASTLANPSKMTPLQVYVSYRMQKAALGAGAEKTGNLQCTAPLARVAAPTPVSLKTNSPVATVANDCFGCCGAGCSGCTGCYTSACALHDACHGSTPANCTALLAAAIASMWLFCH